MPQFSLTHDGALHLRAPQSLLPFVKRWLPLHAVECDVAAADILIDVVEPGSIQLPQLPLEPTLRMGDTACMIAGDVAWIRGPGNAATIELARAHASVELDPDARALDVIAPLTLAAALLLARARRYLLHCAAVCTPDGSAWLLAGDSRSGKTSTSLNLARAGWELLADDHVVLRAADDGWEVEGWPRMLHPDVGWHRGELTGIRTELDPRTVAGLRMRSHAQLAGILLPRVTGDVTSLHRAPHSDALAMVLRQGAWSIADRAVAATALADIAAATRVPAFSIHLAADTFSDPPALLALVAHRLKASDQ